MKIRLLKDLSEYNPCLTVGKEGTARENKITHNDWGAEMVEVKIPGAPALPIGWNSLEIIDKSFWKLRTKDVKESTQIDLVVGSRGGFKYLRVYSKNKNKESRIYTTNIKQEAERLVLIAKEEKKEVTKIIK